jgi:hypothetical protein
MKEIFIVEASFGSYDSSHTQIVKCFESEKEAKEYSEKYDRVIKKVSDFCADCWSVVSDKDYDGEEEYTSCFYHAIWSKYNFRFEEFNNTNVLVRELVPHVRKRNLDKLID